MDVTFLESNHFYSYASSNSPIQGKTPEDESKWLAFDGFKDIDISLTKASNDSYQTQTYQMGTEVEVCPPKVEGSKFPLSPVANDPSPDNINEIKSLISPNNNNVYISVRYELSYMHNRGKPSKRHSLKEEDHRSSYPIANYLFMKDLFEPLKKF